MLLIGLRLTVSHENRLQGSRSFGLVLSVIHELHKRGEWASIKTCVTLNPRSVNVQTLYSQSCFHMITARIQDIEEQPRSPKYASRGTAAYPGDLDAAVTRASYCKVYSKVGFAVRVSHAPVVHSCLCM